MRKLSNRSTRSIAQREMSRLKDTAPENMPLIFVTDIVFQLDISPLNEMALLNMLDIFVALDVSQPDRS